MADPQTRQEIFSIMRTKDRETNNDYASNSMAARFDWAKVEIKKHARTFPVMRGATIKDYYDYLSKLGEDEFDEEERQLHEIAQTTPLEFWKAAYDFDPLGQGPQVGEYPLTRLLCSERLPPIELGKVYGNTTLWLLPRPGSLPISEIKVPRKDYARFPVSLTCSGAISYPDGHPSIEYEKGGSKYQDVIDPQNDNRLRRFCPLGWIARKRGGYNWDLTGHALVMDMDRGRDPWIVLALQWPDVNGDQPEKSTYKAEKRARRDDDPNPGILPGDHTRTVVAKLIHVHEKNLTDEQKAMPFLKQFGPKLSFNLWRKGGDRKVTDSRQFREYHPDLAHIMGWFWDEEEKEEVCYAENGTEYMRYKPSTCGYRYPYLDQVSVVGQNAMFGEVVRQRLLHSRPVPLPERTSSLDTQDEVPRHVQESTTAGY